MAKVTDKQIADTLRQKLAGVKHVEVSDVSGGCGAKFELLVVADAFEGVALLDRHRLVNTALQEELRNIHALSMRTYTSKQWEERKK